jgi:3-phosphoshikimate 1-carboxyvinyltransferase
LGDPVLGDPVGTVTVEGAGLNGIDVSGGLTVRSLDELPLLAVVAAAADGRTRVADAGELRVKESDRIASSVELARLAGAEAFEQPDGFVVDPIRSPLGAGILDADGDHRVAMAAAIAALVRGAPVSVSGFAAADVSWPGFGGVLEGLWS